MYNIIIIRDYYDFINMQCHDRYPMSLLISRPASQPVSWSVGRLVSQSVKKGL